MRQAQSNGIKIIGRDFPDIGKINQKFDVVIAIDVIEHVSNPLKFLQRLSNATKLGGAVIVATGNTDAFSWKLMGGRYWYCTIAEHLVFINPRWCEVSAPSSGLHITQIWKYSHSGKTPLKLKLKESAKNMFYKMCPKCAAWMRSKGMGGEECFNKSGVGISPPSVWITAEDHFMVQFEKVCL